MFDGKLICHKLINTETMQISCLISTVSWLEFCVKIIGI